MSTIRRGIAVVATALLPALAAAGGTSASAPSAASGALPGDEALSCEQIYAQGMAESQKDQQARAQRNDQRRAELGGVMAWGSAALLTGGLGGTGIAANAAAEAQANKTLAEAGAPPPTNARLAHLKQLWAQKHCTAK